MAVQTNITPPRVPFLDPRTGAVSREWYLFFLSLFDLTGGGRSVVTIDDLQRTPAPADISAQLASYLENLLPPAVPFEGQGGVSPPAFDPSAMSARLDALEAAPAAMYVPTPRRYGVFCDTTTQTAAAINTAYGMTFNTTSLASGVWIGSPASRVYVDRAGIYDFQFSAQLNKASASYKQVFIWARINGVDVANSATEVALDGSNAAVVAAWNFVLELNAGDYFELMWSTNDTGCQIVSVASAAPVPAIPSVILTVTDNIKGG